MGPKIPGFGSCFLENPVYINGFTRSFWVQSESLAIRMPVVTTDVQFRGIKSGGKESSAIFSMPCDI